MFKRLGLALILSASQVMAEPLTFLGARTLVSERPNFGGLSAIEVDAAGQRAYVVSDRGAAFEMVLRRSSGAVRLEKVKRWRQPRPSTDVEGLAISVHGTFFSYENPAIIADESGNPLPRPFDFNGFRNNLSLEALAIGPDGALYTLPEGPQGPDRTFPIYRFSENRWDIIARLPMVGPFKPVGADFGPDGWLYVLDRAFTPLGFRSRVTRLDPQANPIRVETLLVTPAGLHDNLEGLSVWQSASGATCLSMISDNNFVAVQRTELVEYALTETLAPGRDCN